MTILTIQIILQCLVLVCLFKIMYNMVKIRRLQKRIDKINEELNRFNDN